MDSGEFLSFLIFLLILTVDDVGVQIPHLL